MKKQQISVMNWYNGFSCIGGACPITCCDINKWMIVIDPTSIQKYKTFDSPIYDKVNKSIDFEKSCFKSRRAVFGEDVSDPDYCALLNDDGLCEMVLNHGEGILCETCHTYPRSLFNTNDYFIQYIDPTCPVVAKMLFTNPLIHQTIDTSFFSTTTTMDSVIFEAMRDSRDFLLDLMDSTDGYVAGKCYIMFDIANSLQSVFDNTNIKAEDIDLALSKYSSVDTITGILEECEQINSNPLLKSEMIKLALPMSKNLLVQFQKLSRGHTNMLSEHVEQWINGDSLHDDFTGFFQYRNQNFPLLIENFLKYRIFSNWIQTTPSEFSKNIKAGYFTILLQEIAAMSAWKENNYSLSIDDFIYIISMFEKAFFHSDTRLQEMGNSIDTIEKSCNYSFFMLPIY